MYYLKLLKWTFQLIVIKILEEYYKFIRFCRLDFSGWWVGYLGDSVPYAEYVIGVFCGVNDKLFTGKVEFTRINDCTSFWWNWIRQDRSNIQISNMWKKTTYSGCSFMHETTKAHAMFNFVWINLLWIHLSFLNAREKEKHLMVEIWSQK